VVTHNAAGHTPDEWTNLHLTGTVQNVAVSATSGKPVVNFTVTDQSGMPVIGLASFTTKTATNLVPSYANVAFTIAKLVPGANGSPSFWANYVVTSMPSTTTAAAPATPTTDNTGTLVDHGNGTYTYTFYRDITAAQAFLDAYTPYTAPKVRADLGDVSFAPALTHRVIVQIGGNARGTSTNTPDGSNTGIVAVPMTAAANLSYDFIPATGKAVAATDLDRDIVNIASCNRCHSRLAVHGGGVRQQTKFCVTCHTDQRKFGAAEATSTTTAGVTTYTGSTSKIGGLAVGNFVAFIHRMHMGEGLANQGYNYANILFNEVTYPQDQRNCVMCHDGTATSAYATPQGDNWKNIPSRLACGACHDAVNFATGANHGTLASGGPQIDDKNCVNCHSAAGIDAVHTPIVTPNPANFFTVSSTNAAKSTGNNNTNASNVAAYTTSLPAGAHVPTWDLKSFTLNASGNPVFVFRFLQDGARKDFQAYTSMAATPTFWSNYVGGPSFYVAFGAPQDGVTLPADWNATASIYFPNAWRGDNKTPVGVALGATASTTLSAPDTNGYYTLTMTGIKVPTTATMLTGGIGYTYGLETTQPLTQTDVPGYPYTPIVYTGLDTTGKYGLFTAPMGQGGVSVPAPNVAKAVASLPAGFPTNAGSTTAGPATATRRAIVTNAKCNDCHAALGIFTDHVYHAGQRNDAPTCTFCHNVNRINSGWCVNIKEAVHSIHAGGKRVNKFSWEATAGDAYWNVTYPAILNDCEACHVPGSYDFSNSTNAAAVPNLLWSGNSAGVATTATSYSIVTGKEVVKATDSVISPWINPTITTNNPAVLPLGSTYGAGWALAFTNVAGVLNSSITQAAAGTLVTSPITAACSACHDTPAAVAHFRGNGGSFYAPRTAAGVLPANVEQCLICHGNGKPGYIRAVHMNWY
jgi:OmcA/MtrC family decaheme c-type cytochrome